MENSIILCAFLFNLALLLITNIILFRKIKKIKKMQKILKIKSTTFYETNGDFVKNHKMGRNSYAGDYFAVADIETRIGNFCSIADNVTLGTTFHPTDRLTTHPFTYFEPMRLTKNAPLIPFSYHTPVIIGNDVWIGKHVTIMDGIKIGDGAIIGTNAVVTKDVPPYAIVVGIPARILRYRFDEKTICDLLQLKWWDLKDEDIANLSFCNIKKCIQELKIMKGKIK